MTTENVHTTIAKTFTLSVYKNGGHIITGYGDATGDCPYYSFNESLSPLSLMIEAFRDRPLGTKIRVTMEEIT